MVAMGRFCEREMVPRFCLAVGFGEGERVSFVLFGCVGTTINELCMESNQV